MILRYEDVVIAQPCGLLRKLLAPTGDYPPRVSPFHGGQRRSAALRRDCL